MKDMNDEKTILKETIEKLLKLDNVSLMLVNNSVKTLAALRQVERTTNEVKQ